MVADCLFVEGARSGSADSTISRGWWVGSTPLRAAVLAQSVRSKTCSTPRDLRYALAEADASFKSTMQARGTDWVARSNGRWQIARSPTVKPLDLSYLSDLASSYPPRLPPECCAVRSPKGGSREGRGLRCAAAVRVTKAASRGVRAGRSILFRRFLKKPSKRLSKNAWERSRESRAASKKGERRALE